jgi:tetratricopeptide (TPR) repeat protein
MKEKDSVKNIKSNFVPAAGTKSEEVNTVAKIQTFIEEKRNLVIGISVGVIIAVVGIFWLVNYLNTSAEEKTNTASFLLSKAQEYYIANDFQKALWGDKKVMVGNKPMLGLVEIASKYEGSKPAIVAALYAGSSFMSLNKPAEAKKYFEMSTKAESPIIKEGSYAGLGACAESEGKYQEAIENYEKAIALAKMPGSKNRYQYFQGLCYEKLGDKEKAGKLYKEIITENASEFVNYAKGGLTRIGMIIE